MRCLPLKAFASIGIFVMARFAHFSSIIWPKLQSMLWKLTASRTYPSSVLTVTVPELISLLQNGKVKSVDLVSCYTAQIKEQNHEGLKLKAVISLVPDHVLLDQARQLDRERASGDSRSPLHGIPFLAKVRSKNFAHG